MQSGHLVKITAFLPADATSPSDMADAAALVAELKRELEGRGFADVTLVSRFGMRRRDKPIDLVAMADSARAAADALQSLRPSEAAIAKANADMDRALDIPSARHQSMIMDEDMRRSEAAAPLPPEERDDPYAIPAALDRRTKAAE